MQKKPDSLTCVWGTLFGRLSDRGLKPAEIPGLIGDVFAIIGGGGDFTVGCVNQALQRLGWRDGTLDEICFELIVFILENEECYEVKRSPLH